MLKIHQYPAKPVFFISLEKMEEELEKELYVIQFYEM